MRPLSVFFLCAIIVSAPVSTLATCGYSIIFQSSTTSANMCPGNDGTFYVNVSDKIKWTDELLTKLVETSHPTYNCATDTAVITRSAGVFIENSDEPWIDYSYYKIQLGRRTTNAPGILFIVNEQYSLSCARPHPSPIVINFQNGGLKLTSADVGVMFDLNSDGVPEQLGWTKPGEDVAFLIRGTTVQNGHQLFGNLSPQAPVISDESENGYRALRLHDLNDDNVIDAQDQIWGELNLWFDWDHNGISEPTEIRPLAEWGVESISLDYKDTGKKDGFGNLHRQRARVVLSNGSWRWSTDFYPAQKVETWREETVVR